MKSKASSTQYPLKITVGNVIITVFNESKPDRPKFRVRWQEATSRVSKVYDNEEAAKLAAELKATELNNQLLPKTEQELREQERRSILFAEYERDLHPFNWSVQEAVMTMVYLLKELGTENLRRFVHLYGPRLAAVRPHLVETVVSAYLAYRTGLRADSQAHVKGIRYLLTSFQAAFSSRKLHDIAAEELEDWLKTVASNGATRDKYIYALKGMYRYAQGHLKALPCVIPTEIEFIQRIRHEAAPSEVLTVEQIKTMARSLPDKETMLAFVLVLFGHLRIDEMQNLERKHINLSTQQISIPDGLAKAKVGEKRGRKIPIRNNLLKMLEVLLPEKGRLFSHNPDVRLVSVGKRLFSRWPRNCLRHCCTSYFVAAGLPKEDCAHNSGHTVEVLEKDYLVPVEPKDAKEYAEMIFDLEKLGALPCYQRTKLPQAASVSEDGSHPDSASADSSGARGATQQCVDFPELNKKKAA